MQAALPIALLTALMAVAQTTELHPRSATQASRYCDRDSECVLLTHCPGLQGLLQSQSRDAILERRALRCGTQGTIVMVCCPIPRPLPAMEEPPTLSTTAPTIETPVTSPITSLSAEEPPTPPIPSLSRKDPPTFPIPFLSGEEPPTPPIPSLSGKEPPTHPITSLSGEEPPTPPIPSLSGKEPPAHPITSTTAPHAGEALLPSLCGQRPPLEKIYLGTTALVAEYPWSAILGFKGRRPSDPLLWNCGGSLINDRYVLTAAHCTIRRMTNNMELAIVRLGEFNLDSDEECFGQTPRRCYPAPAVLDLSPVEVVRHPDFNTRGVYSDDVALIRLDSAVTLSWYIQPVCLPAPGKTFSDLIGDISPKGIGFEVKESGLRGARLRHVTLFMMPMKECQSIYNSTMGTGEGQVCLRGPKKSDVCLHHPGAPVSVPLDPYGPPIAQVGITSYAALPCQQDVPALYTDVTYYRDWIVGSLRP